jgi:hypothetical protein
VNVEFETISGSEIKNGHIVYRAREFSFDFEPAPLRSFTSFLVNDLNLEVDTAGTLLSVWGLCPHPGWQRGEVRPPPSIRSEVKVRTDRTLSRGVSESLSGRNRWPVIYDHTSGWIVIGNPNDANVFIEFVTGAILGIDSTHQLRVLWLKACKGL